MPKQFFEQVGETHYRMYETPQAMKEAVAKFNEKGLRVVQFIKTPIGLPYDDCYLHALLEKAKE